MRENFGTAMKATDDNMARRMRFALCITKATDPQSEYVIFITFPWQQCLSQRASMLRCCLSFYSLFFKQYPTNVYRISSSNANHRTSILLHFITNPFL
jgi:hypothetical protein